MEGVLAAFAQFDNDVRSERTRAGMRAPSWAAGRSRHRSDT
jgi:DNA invertase Pin-like site-specific DNA recombinase